MNESKSWYGAWYGPLIILIGISVSLSFLIAILFFLVGENNFLTITITGFAIIGGIEIIFAAIPSCLDAFSRSAAFEERRKLDYVLFDHDHRLERMIKGDIEKDFRRGLVIHHYLGLSGFILVLVSFFLWEPTHMLQTGDTEYLMESVFYRTLAILILIILLGLFFWTRRNYSYRIKLVKIPRDILVPREYEVLKELSAQSKDLIYPNRLKIEQKRIIKLDLTGLDLKSFPLMICDLYNLRELILNNNQLQTLPETISRLTNLQTLMLGQNQLQTLPETIVRLTNLQTLMLGQNQLQSLPETISRLINLQKISVWKNNLIFIPESLNHLTNLRVLAIGANPLSQSAKQIVNELQRNGVMIQK